MCKVQSIFEEAENAINLDIIPGIKLTIREVDILACLVNHLSTKEIAKILSISPRTVETHLRNLMLKFECSSKEYIVRSLKKMSHASFFKKHYSSLENQVYFKEALNETARLITHNKISCLIIYDKNNDFKNLTNFIEKHLMLIGLEVQYKDINQLTAQTWRMVQAHAEQENGIIVFLPDQKGKSPDFSKIKDQRKLVPVTLQESQSFNNKHSRPLILNQILNKYIFFIEILARLYPDVSFLSIKQNLLQQFNNNFDSNVFLPLAPYESCNSQIEKEKQGLFRYKLYFPRKRLWLFIFSAIFICAASIFFTLKTKNCATNKPSIRSELILPKDNFFLSRPKILRQIEAQFNKKETIQTIALIGTGGAGKTTIARQYMRTLKKSTAWEINSETTESIMSGFEALAYALAYTEEESKYFRALLQINNAQERERKILEIVKKALKRKNAWVLLFDNVESFSSIQRYFPHDPSLWGYGHILITTRNYNIQNNTNIDATVFIEELSSKEKYELFSKIQSRKFSISWTEKQKLSAISFLKELPSYPLDISIAAYYLNTVNISYEKYLQHLHAHENNFNTSQENIIRDASDYKKTRYNIITISLQELINIDKKYLELLLLISVMNSQNIPCALLASFTSESISESFIYQLKKYSLIELESKVPNQDFPTISLNRITQSIILNYLEKFLKDNPEIFIQLSKKLENFINYAIDSENIPLIKGMLTHYKFFVQSDIIANCPTLKKSIDITLTSLYCATGNYLNATSLLEKNFKLVDGEEKSLINADYLKFLGIIYGNYGDYMNGIKFLQKSLKIRQAYLLKDFRGLSQTLVGLGILYRNTGKYKESEKYLNEAAIIYKENLPDSTIGKARVLRYLGLVYRDLGQFNKAKQLLEDSLRCYKQLNSLIGRSGSLIYLGDIQRSLGNVKQAQELLEQAYKNYKSYFPANHPNIAWAMGYLGILYHDCGWFEKAKIFLEEAISNYRDNSNYSGVAWLLVHLGEVYMDLKHYERARICFEESKLLNNKHFPNNFKEKAWVLGHLGSLYRELGQFEKAEEFYHESLKLYTSKFYESPMHIGWTLAEQGENFLRNGNLTQAKNALEQCRRIYEACYGRQHPKIAILLNNLAEISFLEGHIDRAEEMLKESLSILSQSESPRSYKLYEKIASIYNQEYQYTKDK